jgi:hypothetical protein
MLPLSERSGRYECFEGGARRRRNRLLTLRKPRNGPNRIKWRQWSSLTSSAFTSLWCGSLTLNWRRKPSSHPPDRQRRGLQPSCVEVCKLSGSPANGFGRIWNTSPRASSPTRTTPDLTAALAQFWPAYGEMLTLLARVFPADQLQGINVKLEEEIELSGFSPMKGSLDTNNTVPAGQVHPNDEYLLRISDILTDAALIADADVGTAFHCSQLRIDHI